MNVLDILVWYPMFVLSTTCHEFAHAYAAFRGGDLTAYEGGQVSLDPIPHIRRSPFGMVVVPLLSFLQAGWMMGWASAPYDPVWARRFPRRAALMSLAGPLANLLLALAALVVLWLLLYLGVFVPTNAPRFSRMVAVPDGSSLGAVAMALSILLNLNVLLGLFNLIPIPPLDGAGVAEGVSSNAATLYERMQQIPMSYLLGILIAWNLFDYIVNPVLVFVYRALYFLF